MKQIILLFAAACMSGCFGQAAPAAEDALKGSAMPSFNLQMVDSTTWLNTKDIATGMPSVFLYYSPHCPYCRALLDDIIKTEPRLKDIHFYMVTHFSYAEMKDFYDEYKLDQYKNITAGRDTADFFAKYFTTPGFPYIAVYGADRKLNKTFIGTQDINDIISASKNI